MARPTRTTTYATNGTTTMSEHDAEPSGDQPTDTAVDPPAESPADAADEMRSGFVALAGRPNVGKSSLTNAIVGQKVTIVSPRPQTTRHEIRGMLTTATSQLILVDTPGVHKPKTAMGKRLNRTAKEAREDTDATVLVVDASKGVGGPGDARLMAAMPDDVIVAINKIDRLPQEQVLAAIKDASSLARRFEKGSVEFFPISARTSQGVPELTEHLIGRLPLARCGTPRTRCATPARGFGWPNWFASNCWPPPERNSRTRSPPVVSS